MLKKFKFLNQNEAPHVPDNYFVIHVTTGSELYQQKINLILQNSKEFTESVKYIRNLCKHGEISLFSGLSLKDNMSKFLRLAELNGAIVNQINGGYSMCIEFNVKNNKCRYLLNIQGSPHFDLFVEINPYLIVPNPKIIKNKKFLEEFQLIDYHFFLIINNNTLRPNIVISQ